MYRLYQQGGYFPPLHYNHRTRADTDASPLTCVNIWKNWFDSPLLHKLRRTCKEAKLNQTGRARGQQHPHDFVRSQSHQPETLSVGNAGSWTGTFCLRCPGSSDFEPLFVQRSSTCETCEQCMAVKQPLGISVLPHSNWDVEIFQSYNRDQFTWRNCPARSPALPRSRPQISRNVLPGVGKPVSDNMACCLFFFRPLDFGQHCTLKRKLVLLECTTHDASWDLQFLILPLHKKLLACRNLAWEEERPWSASFLHERRGEGTVPRRTALSAAGARVTSSGLGNSWRLEGWGLGKRWSLVI